MPTDDEILAEMALGLEDDPFAELEANFTDAPTGVKALNGPALVRKLTHIRHSLYELGEMYGEPRTDQGRELHSQRTAVLLEMRERGML